MLAALVGSVAIPAFCADDAPKGIKVSLKNKIKSGYSALLNGGKKLLKDEQIGPWIKRSIPEVIVIAAFVICWRGYKSRSGKKLERGD